MGIYIVSNKVLDYIPEDQAYGFDHLMLQLIEKKKRVNVEMYDGYWLDIGRPDDYMVAIDTFDKMKDKFLG